MLSQVIHTCKRKHTWKDSITKERRIKSAITSNLEKSITKKCLPQINRNFCNECNMRQKISSTSIFTSFPEILIVEFDIFDWDSQKHSDSQPLPLLLDLADGLDQLTVDLC